MVTNYRRGQQVPMSIQDRLTALGYAIHTSGNFDLATEAAVRDFQAFSGLQDDGVVGPKTQAALNAGRVYTPARDPIDITLAVPYFSQRDNLYDPTGTCNVTSLAMVLAYKGVPELDGTRQLEDSLSIELRSPAAEAEFLRAYPALVRRYEARHVHGMLVWLAKQHGVAARFVVDAEWSEIEAEVHAGNPVMISGRFTASGHVVVIIGLTRHGDPIIHDPWGDWNQGYRGATDGRSRIYRKADLDVVLHGGPGRHWAHFYA